MSHFDRALSFGPMEADLREARSKARLDWLCVGLQTAKCQTRGTEILLWSPVSRSACIPRMNDKWER